jgi:hypothetical protein
VKSKKATLTESVKEVTGDKDKQVEAQENKEEDGNIINLRKLAGI